VAADLAAAAVRGWSNRSGLRSVRSTFSSTMRRRRDVRGVDDLTETISTAQSREPEIPFLLYAAVVPRCGAQMGPRQYLLRCRAGPAIGVHYNASKAGWRADARYAARLVRTASPSIGAPSLDRDDMIRGRTISARTSLVAWQGPVSAQAVGWLLFATCTTDRHRPQWRHGRH